MSLLTKSLPPIDISSTPLASMKSAQTMLIEFASTGDRGGGPNKGASAELTLFMNMSEMTVTTKKYNDEPTEDDQIEYVKIKVHGDIEQEGFALALIEIGHKLLMGPDNIIGFGEYLTVRESTPG